MRIERLFLLACGCTCRLSVPGEELPDAAVDDPETRWVRPDAGSPPPADPWLVDALTKSAEAKIDAALRRGDIDEKTAALYRVYAYWASSRLPAQYVAETTAQLPWDFGVAQLADEYRDQYSPAERAVLDAVMSVPSGASYHAFAPGPSARQCWETRLDGTEVYSAPISTTHFDFYAASNQGPAALATLESTLRARLTGNVTITKGALAGMAPLQQHFEQAFTVLSGLGYTSPMSNPRHTAINGDGGTGRIPVYVVDCSGFGEGGGAASDGHMLLSVGAAFEDPLLSKVVVPHELVHLFTNDFGRDGGAPTDVHKQWPIEAIAVALEDYLAKDTKRWSEVNRAGARYPYLVQAMARSFRCSEEPFHSNNSGPCKQSLDLRAAPAPAFPGRSEELYPGNYSKFVFFKWLEKKSGIGALRSYWVTYAASRDPERGITDDQLADFQLALVADPQSDGPKFDPDDRAVFSSATAGLDYEPGWRERYAFRFERSQYPKTHWRIAPPQEASVHEPKAADNTLFPMARGATYRVLIEVPDAPATVDWPGVPTATRSFTGVKPLDRVVYLTEQNGLPQRAAFSMDLGSEVINAFGDGQHHLIYSATHFLLVTFTNPPTGRGTTQLKVGVTIGERCLGECANHYGALITASSTCCPESCRDLDGDAYRECVADCRDGFTASHVAGEALCADYCTGSNQTYGDLMSGDEHASAGPKIYSAAELPSATWSGVVPITRWVDATCTEMGVPPAP